MKKIRFWLWKCFHKKEVGCKCFCPNCEYFEFCEGIKDNEYGGR